MTAGPVGNRGAFPWPAKPLAFAGIAAPLFGSLVGQGHHVISSPMDGETRLRLAPEALGARLARGKNFRRSNLFPTAPKTFKIFSRSFSLILFPKF